MKTLDDKVSSNCKESEREQLHELLKYLTEAMTFYKYYSACLTATLLSKAFFRFIVKAIKAQGCTLL